MARRSYISLLCVCARAREGVDARAACISMFFEKERRLR